MLAINRIRFTWILSMMLLLACNKTPIKGNQSQPQPCPQGTQMVSGICQSQNSGTPIPVQQPNQKMAELPRSQNPDGTVPNRQNDRDDPREWADRIGDIIDQFGRRQPRSPNPETSNPNRPTQPDNPSSGDNNETPPQAPAPVQPITQPDPVSPAPEVPPMLPDACVSPVNSRVNIGGYMGNITGSKGIFDIAILGPNRIGSIHTTFPDGTSPHLYQGGTVRQGKTVYGTFIITGAEGQQIVWIKLDIGGARVGVGRILDSAPNSGQYPRLGRIQLDFGACLTQYATDNGGLFSAGLGYLVLP